MANINEEELIVSDDAIFNEPTDAELREIDSEEIELISEDELTYILGEK